jgi:hypothetical protein
MHLEVAFPCGTGHVLTSIVLRRGPPPLRRPDRRPPPDRNAIAQLPPEAGLVADEGVAVPAFLGIFLCELVVAGAMVLAPDAPETVSVDPPAFGLLIPVPPCPPAAPPPAPWAKTLLDIPTRSTEIKIPFVATRMAVPSSTNRSTPDGANPYVRDRNSHTVSGPGSVKPSNDDAPL